MALLTWHTNKHFLRHRTGQEDIRRKELKQGKADRWTDEPKCDSVTAASCEWGGFFRTAAGLPGYDQGPCFGRALSNRLEGQGWSQTGRMSYSHCNKQSATFLSKCKGREKPLGPAYVWWLTKLWLTVWKEDSEDIVRGLVLLLIGDRVWGSRSLRNPLS